MEDELEQRFRRGIEMMRVVAGDDGRPRRHRPRCSRTVTSPKRCSIGRSRTRSASCSSVTASRCATDRSCSLRSTSRCSAARAHCANTSGSHCVRVSQPTSSTKSASCSFGTVGCRPFAKQWSTSAEPSRSPADTPGAGGRPREGPMTDQLPVDRLYHPGMVVRDARATARTDAEIFGITTWNVARCGPDHLSETVTYGLAAQQSFTYAFGTHEESGLLFQLIEPHERDASTFKEFLAVRGQGVHNLCTTITSRCVHRARRPARLEGHRDQPVGRHRRRRGMALLRHPAGARRFPAHGRRPAVG